MDSNNVIISGEVGWRKLSMAKDLPFGSLKVRINLPLFSFDMRGEKIIIERPIVWVNISMNCIPNTKNLKKRDQNIVDNITTTPYIIIRQARVTNWQPKNNSPLQHSIEVSPSNVSLSKTPIPIVNKCIFEGKVIEYEPTGKMTIKCQYIVPKTNKWKSRFIPIIHTEKFEPYLTNEKVLLFGRVCATTPKGENKLYVISEEIFPIT